MAKKGRTISAFYHYRFPEIKKFEEIMIDNLIPFTLFVIAMCATPGPGNLTMMAIGQTTGFSSSIPLLIGTSMGSTILNSMVACGLGSVIMTSSFIGYLLRVGGMIYILYLSWKILRMQLSSQNVAKRFSFIEGFIIHPVSPKSWAMSIVAFSQFMKTNQPLVPQAIIFVAGFLIGVLVFHSSWCAAGALIPHVLSSKRLQLCINCIMVFLMVSATGYVMLS